MKIEIKEQVGCKPLYITQEARKYEVRKMCCRERTVGKHQNVPIVIFNKNQAVCIVTTLPERSCEVIPQKIS